MSCIGRALVVLWVINMLTLFVLLFCVVAVLYAVVSVVKLLCEVSLSLLMALGVIGAFVVVLSV